jgi:hypothetical protein
MSRYCSYFTRASGEMADALASGASVRKDVGVQVPPRPPVDLLGVNMGLWSDFLTNQGKVIHKWKHYFPAYESHFQRFVGRPVVFWEIGVYKGGSLQMWKRYLGPHAQIIGIDIDPSCLAHEEDQIAVRIGDQADQTFLQSVIDEFGVPDVVLDDVSHRMEDLAATFTYLYPRISSTGVYFVEDLHTCYWADYGGGLRHPDSFIERTKHLVDELNADWTDGELSPTDFTRSTMSMHFYDSCVVFERGRHLEKSAPKTGHE